MGLIVESDSMANSIFYNEILAGTVRRKDIFRAGLLPDFRINDPIRSICDGYGSGDESC